MRLARSTSGPGLAPWPWMGDMVRSLLEDVHVDQRILFYTTRNEQRLAKVNAVTADLEHQLWSAVRGAASQPTPLVALAVSGMNDVLNSQGYTQAASWNRIPREGWGLVAAIAICCNILIGYGARQTHHRAFIILPLALSIAFFLISDIDSPRRGAIRVVPQNLLSLAQSLHTQ